jgi:hypothetical protein
MVELDDGVREILFIGRDLMNRLVASDDWLPAAFGASGCSQLYRDGMARFSPVCLRAGPTRGDVHRRRPVLAPDRRLARFGATAAFFSNRWGRSAGAG